MRPETPARRPGLGVPSPGPPASANAPATTGPGTAGRLAGTGDPSSRPGKEWHVTVESGAATTAALHHPTQPPQTQPAPEVPDQEGFVQLLTPEGERIEHPDYPVELSAADIRDMYRDLVLVRRIDTEAIALQRQGELGIWASLLGQEAAQIGSARSLGPQDMVFPTYREHGVAWCRGIDPVKLLELY